MDGVSYAHFLGDAAGRGVRYLRYRDIAGGSILSSFSMHAARRSLPQTARAIAMLSWTPLDMRYGAGAGATVAGVS